MPHSEVANLDFNREQGQAIDLACHSLTELGGPQAGKVAAQANLFAKQLESILSPDQKSTLRRFSDGSLSALMFRQMPFPTDPPPDTVAASLGITGAYWCASPDTPVSRLPL